MSINNNEISDLLDDINSRGSFVNSDGFDPNGTFVAFDKAIYSIARHMESLLLQNERLKKENEKLKNEAYKDDELKTLKENLEEMRNEYNRGFPVSNEEAERIRKWKEEHLRKCHPRALKDPSYFGCIGGNFTYSFVPTSIGTIGTVKCSCGEEFTFSEI